MFLDNCIKHEARSSNLELAYSKHQWNVYKHFNNIGTKTESIFRKKHTLNQIEINSISPSFVTQVVTQIWETRSFGKIMKGTGKRSHFSTHVLQKFKNGLPNRRKD